MVYVVRLIAEVNKIHLNPFEELSCDYRNERPSASVSCPANADLATLEESHDLRSDNAVVALRDSCPRRVYAGVAYTAMLFLNDIKD